jgi:hypothetical protein
LFEIKDLNRQGAKFAKRLKSRQGFLASFKESWRSFPKDTGTVCELGGWKNAGK